MTETYSNSFSSTYLRPSYPIDFGRSSRTAAAETPSPYATALTTGLASMLRTAAPRAAQPIFADGFVWLLKVLSNHATRPMEKRNHNKVTPADSENPAQRRKERLLLEVPERLEAQARPTSTH